jgi:SAM-dependent methyltransferase
MNTFLEEVARKYGKTIRFTCNICGEPNEVSHEAFDGTEIVNCATCGSTVRHRSVIYLTTRALLGKAARLPSVHRMDLKGVGLSDHPAYAERLARSFDYTNTFYHCEPFLDISAPVSATDAGSLDFMISSDVFEHITPPVDRAFRAAFDWLKPGGHLILTVPNREGETIEHYPDLREFEIRQVGDRYSILGRNEDGKFVVHDDPIFHGGPGQTVEMRLFGTSDLKTRLQQAGFPNPTFLNDDVPEDGVIFSYPWTRPLVARKPV